MTHVDGSSNGGTVSVVVGDVLEVTLAENPITGYRWNIGRSARHPAHWLTSPLTPAATARQVEGRHKWRIGADALAAGASNWTTGGRGEKKWSEEFTLTVEAKP